MPKNIMIRVSPDLYDQIKAVYWSTASVHRLSFNAWAIEVLKAVK